MDPDDALEAQHFLNILMGARPVNRNGTNDQLVDHLCRSNLVHTAQLERVMRTLSRAWFAPAEQQENALVDAPIRLVELGFNFSAPHVYAICLEALDIQPGHDFLDVGSGTGYLTALGALLAGPSGSALGLDIKQTIVSFAQNNVTRVLRDSGPGGARHNAAHALTAPDVAALRALTFEQRNCFLPDIVGRRFDRLHAGATCPEENVRDIVALLKPGGIAVFPCGNELLKCTKTGEGTFTREVLSQVSYGELVVPSEAEVERARLVVERRKARQVVVPRRMDRSSQELEQWLNQAEDKWQTPSEGADVVCVVGRNVASDGKPTQFFVHRDVLSQRSDQFHARFASGMKDANSTHIELPDTSPAAFKVLLHFMYLDECTLTSDVAPEVLELASFYQVPRLLALCEAYYDDCITDDSVCHILELADRHGAFQLRRVCMQYILDRVPHNRSISALLLTLSPELLVEVVEAAAGQLALITGAL